LIEKMEKVVEEIELEKIQKGIGELVDIEE
jgi:hypothetical protein